MQARTVQITVSRPWRELCEFLAQPRNYPLWASWLGSSLRQHRGDWIASRPGGGPAKVRFTERNAFGVADHCLLEDEDRERYIALRAVPHGGGTEVILTLFREPDCGDAQWRASADAALQDLGRLKALIERRVSAAAWPRRAGWPRTPRPPS
jgi:hypothetical protein